MYSLSNVDIRGKKGPRSIYTSAIASKVVCSVFKMLPDRAGLILLAVLSTLHLRLLTLALAGRNQIHLMTSHTEYNSATFMDMGNLHGMTYFFHPSQYHLTSFSKQSHDGLSNVTIVEEKIQNIGKEK